MVVAVLALCIFGVFVVYPDYRIIEEQKATVESLRFKLKKQKMLLPLHRLLSDQLEFFEKSDRFSNIASTPCELEMLIRRIRELAKSHRFDLAKVDLEKPSLNASPTTLRIKIVMSGMFVDLNPYFKELLSISCPMNIELIQIRALPESDEIIIELSSSIR